MDSRERLALSERVISGWEAVGGPAGRLADTMRMIREECVALAEIAASQPSLADRAEQLIARFQQLAIRMKLQ